MFHSRPCFTNKRTIASSFIVLPDTVNQQQSCINCVVHRFALPFREKIRDQSILFISKESSQYTFGILIPTCCQTATRQGNHGVTSPIAKERITSKNGLTFGRLPLGNKCICTNCQLPCQWIRKAAARIQLMLTFPIFFQQPFRRRRVLLQREHNSPLYSASCRYCYSNAAATGTVSMCRTTILRIFWICKFLPTMVCFFKVGIRTNIKDMGSICNAAPGIIICFLLFKSCFLRCKFQEGIDLEFTFFSRKILNFIQHSSRILSPTYTERSFYGHTP